MEVVAMNYCKRSLFFTFTLLVVMISTFSCSQNNSSVSSVETQSSSTELISTTSPSQPASKLYTSCNLWYERPDAMYCVNYKKGAIIPAGTEVRNIYIGKGARAIRTAIKFTFAETGQEFSILYQDKFHPGISIESFKDRLFTSKNFDELTSGFTQDEINSIKQGTVSIGMSKKAVLVSYGYPPEHETFSTESNT